MTGFIPFALLLIATASIASEKTETVKTSALDQSEIQLFCTDKPIWSAFGIESASCIQAAQHCAQKPEFAQLDPELLSEEFYQCVFQQLGIEVD